MSFHYPSIWFLLLLLVLPLLWWRWRRRDRSCTVPYSSLNIARQAPTGWGVYLRWIVPVLRSLAIILLIVALARPQLADQQTRIRTEGIAIQLVMDRSGSMQALDFQLEGKRASRLEAVKKVVEDFVIGSGDLPGRPNDLVGMINFASFADSICPLTLDHNHLSQTIRQMTVASESEGSATALGDAIALGVERLYQIGLQETADGRNQIKSRIMIVLTDGENNAGEIDPVTAAELAATFDIKIYTIGAGSNNSRVPVPVTNPFTGETEYRQVRVSIDEETLRNIAETTNGEYFRAKDTDTLQEVYARIDELEKTEIEQRQYTRYAELAIQPQPWRNLTIPPILIITIIILLVEALLANTRLQTLP